MLFNINYWELISAISTGFLNATKFWELWLLLVGIYLINNIPYFLEKYRLSKSGIEEIDKMDGKSFEKYLEIKFRQLGYNVIRTQYVGDYGADLIVEKDGIKWTVQAKRYKEKVGIRAIQEVFTSKGEYNCEKAMVVTNSFFTRQAKRLANKNNVELWDRNELSRRLLTVKNIIKNKDEFKADDQCVLCNVHVSEKVYQYCLDHSALFEGKIYCYEHQHTLKKHIAN